LAASAHQGEQLLWRRCAHVRMDVGTPGQALSAHSKAGANVRDDKYVRPTSRGQKFQHISSAYRKIPSAAAAQSQSQNQSGPSSAASSCTPTPRHVQKGGAVHAMAATPRAQHWAIIDALEENHAAAGTADPAALIAAYLQLAALYERDRDKLGARMATENARAIEHAAIKGKAKNANIEIKQLVFQFCINAFKEGAAVDEQAVSVAATRLADIRASLNRGATPMPTPREAHWRVIDLLESSAPHVDTQRLVHEYGQLAIACDHCGDAWGAAQARDNAQLVQLSSDVERQLFYIDKMEESDFIDLDALSVAYAELARLYTKQGDVGYASDAEKDAQKLHAVYMEGGMSNRTPRSVLFPNNKASEEGGFASRGYEGEEEEGYMIYSARDRYNPRPSTGGGDVDVDVGRGGVGQVSTILEESHQSMLLGDQSMVRSDASISPHSPSLLLLDNIGNNNNNFDFDGNSDYGSFAERHAGYAFGDEGSLGDHGNGSVMSGLTSTYQYPFNPGQSIGSLDSTGIGDGDGDGGSRGGGGGGGSNSRFSRKSAIVTLKPDMSDAKYQKHPVTGALTGGYLPQGNMTETSPLKLKSKFFQDETSVDHSSLNQQSLMSFGSLKSDATIQNVVTIDCTTVAMGHLEDILVRVKVKLVHLHARFTSCEKIKGRCEVTLTYSTGRVELTYKWAYQLAFIVTHDEREFFGKLHLSHMTKENIFADLKPYPQEITWKDGISPIGVDFNQVVAVLQSSKCRNAFREGYKQFEEVVIAGEFVCASARGRTRNGWRWMMCAIHGILTLNLNLTRNPTLFPVSIYAAFPTSAHGGSLQELGRQESGDIQLKGRGQCDSGYGAGYLHVQRNCIRCIWCRSQGIGRTIGTFQFQAQWAYWFAARAAARASPTHSPATPSRTSLKTRRDETRRVYKWKGREKLFLLYLIIM